MKDMEVGLYTCGKCHIVFRVLTEWPENEPISRCWECPRQYFDAWHKETRRVRCYMIDDGDEAIGRHWSLATQEQRAMKLKRGRDSR